MSIIDSPEDLIAAQERVAATSEEQLGVDLVYWTTATQDAIEEHDAIIDRARAKKLEYHEAQQWVALTVAEIRRRRDAKRSKADG